MNNLKITPYAINFWVIGISLIPRLLSPCAFKSGTMYILFFWLPWLVFFPELIKNEGVKKIPIKRIPSSTKIILAIISIILIFVFIYRNTIYAEDSEGFIKYLRRILYLINPIICISWYACVRQEKIHQFFVLLLSTTGCLIGVLVAQMLLLESSISYALNCLTAELSSVLVSPLIEMPTNAYNNSFGNKKFQLDVRWGCSSLPDIILSLNCIFVFYICSKIKKLKNLILILILSFLLPFTINSIRISLLAYFVFNNRNTYFDFWHDGLGSLIFTFIILSIVSSLYYKFWIKENKI